jgi:hypothetical protein
MGFDGDCRDDDNRYRSQLWSVGDGGYMDLLALAIFSAAFLLVAQTALDGKYFWAVSFAAIAVLSTLSPHLHFL